MHDGTIEDDLLSKRESADGSTLAFPRYRYETRSVKFNRSQLYNVHSQSQSDQ